MDATIIQALRLTAEGLQSLAAALESGQVGVPDPPNLTVEDVATLLNCATDTVRSAVHREGDPIPVIRIGTLLRFRRSEIMEWAERQKPRSKPVKQKDRPPVRPAAPIGLRKAQRRTA